MAPQVSVSVSPSWRFGCPIWGVRGSLDGATAGGRGYSMGLLKAIFRFSGALGKAALIRVRWGRYP